MIRVSELAVIGGGALGASYVRRLLRASLAGRLEFERILVVDRDPACAAALVDDPRLELAFSEWSEWLDAGLDRLAPGSHLVPHHWAPHLLLEWLTRQAQGAGARVAHSGAPLAAGLPYERPTRDGSLALSFATWTCPPGCVEPERCPHTRAPRGWSLAGRLSMSPPTDELPLVFRCEHLVYGVATVPVDRILESRDRLLDGLPTGPRRYLVATASHCHGLAARIEVAPGERGGADCQPGGGSGRACRASRMSGAR